MTDVSRGRWYFDIESNGLLDNTTVDYTASPWKLRDNFTIHCIVATDVDTLETVEFVQEECYTKFQKWVVDNVKESISHNGINFDLLACKAALSMDYEIGPDTWCGKPVVIHDTYVLSKTLCPDRRGHSIDYFGQLLGFPKIDWRAKAIELGLIERNAPKGAEFTTYHPEMLVYCRQDVLVGVKTFHYLVKEWGDWPWQEAYDLEKAVAELITRQGHRGFWFDMELARNNVIELDQLLAERKERVEPNLPQKPMGATKLKGFISPATQFLKSGKPSTHITKWVAKHGGELVEEDGVYKTNLYGKDYTLPIPQVPVVTHEPAEIDDTTFIKGVLVEMGWQPSQYKERDLTVDTKKQKLSYEKFADVIERYVKQTLDSPFCKDRCEKLGTSPARLRDKLAKHDLKKPLKVYTNPTFTVGQEKEIDPALEQLADSFPYVKDIVEYLTYKHRRNSILGGGFDLFEDDEDDFETGFIPNVRQDGRIPTPADTCGAACIAADSLLVTDAGLKKIVDVSIGDLVLTSNGQYERVVDRINNGIKPTLKVVDCNGNELICTYNHKFFTPKGWVKAEDLLVGSEVYGYQEKEEWRKVKNLSRYYVSSWGRVLSEEGNYLSLNRRTKLHDRALVDLVRDDGTHFKESVGRLVLFCFSGEPESGEECCHKDGNPTNNYKENLYWGTSADNKKDMMKHGRALKASRGRKEGRLTQEIVEQIRAYFDNREYVRGEDTHIAFKYGVSREHIRDIRTGKRWKDGNIDNRYFEDFKIVTVASIEKYGNIPTFDVTVENAHSYVSNGFVTHNTSRFKHKLVCNTPRVTSLYGKNMRGMFGVDPNEPMLQYAYDFASLENRIQSHFCWRYDEDKEYCNSLVLDKPFDSHTMTAKKVSEVIGQPFSRQSAKSVGYACVYGAQASRVAKTVGCDLALGQQIYDAFWQASKPLLDLKTNVEKWWEAKGGKKFIPGIDGRKVNTRSQHALLNSLFQSGGVICAKRVMVYQDKLHKEEGIAVDFWKEDWKSKSYVQQMIAYHK